MHQHYFGCVNVGADECRLWRVLANPSFPQSRSRQFLDVVHHAVLVSLRSELGLPSVVQASQPLVAPHIGEHRLHRANALAIQLPAAQ
jgi:hypothetical protein